MKMNGGADREKAEATIYLSSVTPGLGRYQNAVYRAFQVQGYRCIRLDDFAGSDSEGPIGVRAPTDADSDTFCNAIMSQPGTLVLILGEEYGTTHTGSGKSFAEREYEAAVRVGMPRVAFFASEEYNEPHLVVPAPRDHHKQSAFLDIVRHDQQAFVLAPEIITAVRGFCTR